MPQISPEVKKLIRGIARTPGKVHIQANSFNTQRSTLSSFSTDEVVEYYVIHVSN